MTVADSTPADAVLVAIDIAKLRNEVLIEASGQKRRRRLSVLNSRAEHDRLIDVLLAYGRSVVCAFEATGNYHRPIAWRLAEAGFEVRLVSSLALAGTREALHNSWDSHAGGWQPARRSIGCGAAWHCQTSTAGSGRDIGRTAGSTDPVRRT
jgi:hypothetical protein